MASEKQEAPVSTPATPDPPRRGFVAGFFTIVLGAIVSLTPLAAGLAMLFDPVLRKRRAAGQDGGNESGEDKSPGKLLRITSFDSVPADGTPAVFPVLDDLVDAWNRLPNQPVGAVYLRRVNGTEVQAFNAICPHAGCFVSWSDKRNAYRCPCHNSAFAPDGAKIEVDGNTNPSPRPLDELKVDGVKLVASGDVWVQFVNYYTAKHEQVPKT